MAVKHANDAIFIEKKNGHVHFTAKSRRVKVFCTGFKKRLKMVANGDERPNWINPNDPFFAMFPEQCINRMVWLLRILPTAAPTKEGKPVSILEFFLTMEEESFWLVIDRCPYCTADLLFDVHGRYWQRKADQLANVTNQEDDLHIDILFKSSAKNLSRLKDNKKLLRRRRAKGPLLKLTRLKRTIFIINRNKIRNM